MNKLKTSKRGPYVVFKDYSSSYRELRQKENKPLLYVQRLRQILLEVYKIVNKTGLMYLYEMFNFREMSYDLRTVILLYHLIIKQCTMERNPSDL